jgi:hypothetical protein
MAGIVKAHIKNEGNKSIRIIIYEPRTGAFMREKVMPVSTDRESLALEVARTWLKEEYKFYEYTSEGFIAASTQVGINERVDPTGAEMEETKSPEELAAQGDVIAAPKIKTKKDGSMVLEGQTVVDRDEANLLKQERLLDDDPDKFLSEMEKAITTASANPDGTEGAAGREEGGEPGLDDIIIEDGVVDDGTVVRAAPAAALNALPGFDTESFVGMTDDQKVSVLENYGTGLMGNFLVAGTDFSPPESGLFGGQGPIAKPYECRIDKEKRLKVDIDEGMVEIRGNTYHLGSKSDPSPSPAACKDNVEAAKKEFERNQSVYGKDDKPPEKKIVKPQVPKAKKAVQLDGLSTEQKAKMAEMSKEEKLKNSGAFGDHILEPVPTFRKAKTERVISNRYNSWIVLGRDRDSHLGSGFGGKGNTQCGAIDISVGRMSPNPRTTDAKGELVYTDPIFNIAKNPHDTTGAGTPVMDAARLYLSQKAYIDQYFKLDPGRVGNNEEKPIQKESNPRSAIALKADGIRVIAREGIKLVTGVDGHNSQGGKITARRGIDLIAGNGRYPKHSLQPMIKGNNMVECVNELANMLSETIGAVQSVIKNVAMLDAALATHIHPSPFAGFPDIPSPNLLPVCIGSLVHLASVDTFNTAAGKWNINTWRYTYTRPGSIKSIRSEYNNVN